MNITEETKDQITIICLEGRLDAHTCDAVEEYIQGCIEKGQHRFVLNMEKVVFIDSAGLRVVLVVARDLRSKHQGDMHIADLQPVVSRVFEISGLNHVLNIYNDQENAVKGFSV